MYPNQLHLPELIRRTMFNLRFIEDRKGNGGPFEVAQAINSCLTMIVHLSEANLASKKSIVLADVEASREWPILRSSDTNDDLEPIEWSYQVTLLRHGFAHGQVEFHGHVAGDVTEVEIWNVPIGKTKRAWGTKIPVSELSKMARFIAANFGS